MKHYQIRIHNGLILGLFVCITPDRDLYLHKLGERINDLPDNTVIYANEVTIETLKANAAGGGTYLTKH